MWLSEALHFLLLIRTPLEQPLAGPWRTPLMLREAGVCYTLSSDDPIFFVGWECILISPAEIVERSDS
jgi:hypothetical protein